MNVLELFSGTESFSKVAREKGHKTFTIDNDPYHNPDLCKSILDVKIEDIPFKVDFIWASPPCTEYSRAKTTKRDIEGANKLLLKTIELIIKLRPKYWIIENPQGLIINQFFMKNLNHCIVTYCQYGDTRMKPTYIFNNFNFKGKCCRNGDKCHVSAPRGSRTGTQGLKNSVDRSVIPKKLCEAILNDSLR